MRSILWVAFGLALTVDAGAENRSFVPGEEAELELGEKLVYPRTFESDSRKLRGGVSYVLMNATPGSTLPFFFDAESWKAILPRTKSARITVRRSDVFSVEIVSGNDVAEVTNTLFVRLNRAENRLRFWLDFDKPHAVDDLWGYLEFAPYEARDGASLTLVTFALLVDFGSGIFRGLYEDKVIDATLDVPRRLRDFVDARTFRPSVAPPLKGASAP